MKEEITQALDNLVQWQGFNGPEGPQEAADSISKYIEELESVNRRLAAALEELEGNYLALGEFVGDSG